MELKWCHFEEEGGAVLKLFTFLYANSSRGGAKMVLGVVLKQCHFDEGGAVFNLFLEMRQNGSTLERWERVEPFYF